MEQNSKQEVYVVSEAGSKRCATVEQALAYVALYTQAGLKASVQVDTVALYTVAQHEAAVEAYAARMRANRAPCEMNARRAARLAAK